MSGTACHGIDFAADQLSDDDLDAVAGGVDLSAWEDRLAVAGDDAQFANIELQNALQRQRETLQAISDLSKLMHDTAMVIVRALG